MRPVAIAAVLLILPFVLLSACSSADDKVIQNSPTTFSVSAEWGSAYGGWDAAKSEVTAKGMQFCERAGKQFALRDEQRSQRSFPGAPQKSTITFECIADQSSTGQAAVAAPVQAPNATGQATLATPAQPTSAKRTAAIKKCTGGPKFDFNRYVVCMSKEGESP